MNSRMAHKYHALPWTDIGFNHNNKTSKKGSYVYAMLSQMKECRKVL